MLCFYATVLDVEAFERLLGPCMNIMKRNIDDYEDQLVRIFGSKTNITDIRWKHYVGSYSLECTYFHTVLTPLLFILAVIWVSKLICCIGDCVYYGDKCQHVRCVVDTCPILFIIRHQNFTMCHWCCFSCSKRSTVIFGTVAWTFGT